MASMRRQHRDDGGRGNGQHIARNRHPRGAAPERGDDLLPIDGRSQAIDLKRGSEPFGGVGRRVKSERDAGRSLECCDFVGRNRPDLHTHGTPLPPVWDSGIDEYTAAWDIFRRACPKVAGKAKCRQDTAGAIQVRQGVGRLPFLCQTGTLAVILLKLLGH